MFSSQCKQDQLLETNLFKGYKNGFFVDVGAHDGLKINNTIYFEKYNNWSGINIEPNPNVYSKLIENRPHCINLSCAISTIDNSEVEFVCNTGYTEMLSGIKTHLDPRHVARITRENKVHSTSSSIIKVVSRRLSSILEEHDVTHINYLSIDVEGAEFSVIRSIDFEKVFIDVIGFENNYNDVSLPIVKYLVSCDFKVLHIGTDIFMIHNKSSFLSQSGHSS